MLQLKNQVKNQKRQKSPKEDKIMTNYDPNWFDRNKLKKILAIIDSNKFSYKNKIGEFKYIDIEDLVNNIRNNTISERSAKKTFKCIKRNKKRRNNKKEKVHL